MKSIVVVFSALVGLIAVNGCSTMPTGPSVLVLPGAGKSFDQFRSEDYRCRQYAFGQIGGTTPSQASVASGVGSALTGAAVGAATGAAIGGGKGAAIGAGSGLAMGTIAGGGEAAQVSGYEAQSRYDMGYIQCMYAMGNRVPITGNLIEENDMDEYGPAYNQPAPPPVGR